MIKRLSHTTVFVTSQEEAKEFYTEKLGFEIRTDSKEGGFWWLTVGPKSQPDIEIVLMEVKPGMMFDDATAGQVKELMRKGVFGAGVFEVDDCRKTYDELKARGVEFTTAPTDRFYGIEAVMKDNSGNWFSLTQRK